MRRAEASCLNEHMLAVWQAFIAADAWRHFDCSDDVKAISAEGWPRDVRPYQATELLRRQIASSSRFCALHVGWRRRTCAWPGRDPATPQIP